MSCTSSCRLWTSDILYLSPPPSSGSGRTDNLHSPEPDVKNYDATIVVDSTQIHTHQVMLAAGCSVLRRCLEEVSNPEGDGATIIMAFYEQQDVGQLVDLLYGRWKEDSVKVESNSGLLKDVGFTGMCTNKSTTDVKVEVVLKEKMEEKHWGIDEDVNNDDSDDDGDKDYTPFDDYTYVKHELSDDNGFNNESSGTKRKRGRKRKGVSDNNIFKSEYDEPTPNKKSRVNSKHIKKDFKCQLCPASETDGESLLVHFKKSHQLELITKEDNLLKCPVDGCSYRHEIVEAFESHLIWQHSKAFCPFCGQVVNMAKSKDIESHLADCLSTNSNCSPYLCHLCRTPFWRRAEVSEHINKDHSGEMAKFLPRRSGQLDRVFCPEESCDFSIIDNEDVYVMCNHFAECHGQALCPYCFRKFNLKPSSLKEHARISHGVSLRRCVKCTNIYSNRQDYLAHKKKVHNVGPAEGLVMCERCGCDYPTTRIQKHVQKCTGKVKNSVLAQEAFSPKLHPLVIEPKATPDSADGKYTCPLCGDKFKTTIAYNFHLNHLHNNQVCPECGETFAFDRIIDHVAIDHNRIVMMKGRAKKAVGRCDVCEKVVYTTWEEHKKEGCEAPYRNKVPYRNPKMKLALEVLPDTKLGRFHCVEEGCKVTKCIRSDMVKHFWTEHDAQTCPECGKVYNYHRILRHIAIYHTGETRHACEHCGERFYDRLDLRDHVESEHESQGEKWICDICGKGFAIKSKHQRHVNEHNRHPRKFPCQACGKHFRSRINLVDHLAGEHPALVAEGGGVKQLA